MPAMPTGPSRAPSSVSGMIPSAFLDAETVASIDPSKATVPLAERALDKLVGYRKSQGQVVAFRPEADFFFELSAEIGSDRERFNSEANAEVSRNPDIALGAALAGVQLNQENKALAVQQLADYKQAEDAAFQRLRDSFN